MSSQLPMEALSEASRSVAWIVSLSLSKNTRLSPRLRLLTSMVSKGRENAVVSSSVVSGEVRKTEKLSRPSALI